MPTAIFDLDGTLADTSGDLIAAANACFRRRGLGDLLDPARDAATAFHGGRAMLRLGHTRAGGLGDAGIDEDFSHFLDYYAANIDRHTTVYPGVEPALAALLAAGWRLGICTNKPEGLAEELMRRLGMRDLFGSLVGADTLPVRKPDPAPYAEAVSRTGGEISRSFLVGDTATDRDTARAAGVPCALVTFGPAGMAVADHAPEALLHHFDDLPALAVRLLERARAT